MRHGTTNNRRQRSRNGGGNGGGRRGGQPKTQVYDSNGPDVRIRGTAHQVAEKYQTLAKDATSSGDPILAQSYLQHAEHYQRIINSWEENAQENRNSGGNQSDRKARSQDDDFEGNEDDLGLPSSILGGSSKEKSQDGAKGRTSELTTS